MLLTKEQFIKKNKNILEIYEKPVYQCPKCGGDVRVDLSVMYAVNPPKYKYFCTNKECNYKEVL